MTPTKRPTRLRINASDENGFVSTAARSGVVSRTCVISPVNPLIEITGNPGTPRAETRDQLASVHAGHHHVGQEQIDVDVRALDEGQRRCTIGRFEHAVSAALEQPPHDVPHALLVVHDEHGAWRRGGFRRRFLGHQPTPRDRRCAAAES